jgi:hypothetical protein
MLSGSAPKLDIAARITSMSPNQGAATVRVRSISYVDGARAMHRGHSRELVLCSRHGLTRKLSQRSNPTLPSPQQADDTRLSPGFVAEFLRCRTRPGW